MCHVILKAILRQYKLVTNEEENHHHHCSLNELQISQSVSKKNLKSSSFSLTCAEFELSAGRRDFTAHTSALLLCFNRTPAAATHTSSRPDVPNKLCRVCTLLRIPDRMLNTYYTHDVASTDVPLSQKERQRSYNLAGGFVLLFH